MTIEMANRIWKLAMAIQDTSRDYALAKDGSEHNEKGMALIKAKARLYTYLEDNLDDIERL